MQEIEVDKTQRSSVKDPSEDFPESNHENDVDFSGLDLSQTIAELFKIIS